MKIFSVAALLLASTASFAGTPLKVLTGQITIDGSVQLIAVRYLSGSSNGDVSIGDDAYVLKGIQQDDEIEAVRTATVNGFPTVDESVTIDRGAPLINSMLANPKQFASQMNFANASDFACAPGANSLVLIGNNLNPAAGLKAYCLTLTAF